MSLADDFFKQRLFGGGHTDSLNRVLNWPVLFAVAFLVWALQFVLSGGPSLSPDSNSYLVAANNIANGIPDLERTPGVPILLLAFKWIFGSYYLYFFCIFQELLYLLSVILLWDMAKRFIPSSRLVNTVTALYLFLPALTWFFYSNGIDTESCAFAITMVILWLSFRMLVDGSRVTFSSVFLLNAILMAAIAVRPAYIYLLPLYAVFWLVIMFRKRGKRVLIKGLAGVAGLMAVIAGVYGYKGQIRNEYGYDGLTCISYMNNYFLARENNLLNPDFCTVPLLRLELRRVLSEPAGNHSSIWKEINYLEQFDHNYTEMNEVVTESLKSQPYKVATALFKRASLAGSYRLVDYSFEPRKNHLYGIFVPRLSVLYLFLLLYLPFMLYQWKRTGRFPLAGLFLWGFVVCGHAASILGAQDEWARLTYQTFPAFLLLSGRFMSVFRFDRNRLYPCINS